MELKCVVDTARNNRSLTKKGQAPKKYERAANALMTAYKQSSNFKGMSHQHVMHLMFAALQDEYLPLKKSACKHGGSRIKRVINAVRDERYASLELPYPQ